MKAKIYHPSRDDYMACLQRGGGPYYGGSIMQRGYGIGGLFRGLATTFLPLLPKVGNFVAKTVLGVASDKLAGIPLSKAVKKRSTAAGKKMIMNALTNTVRPKSAVKRNKRRRTTGVKRIRTTDAFGTV